MKGGRLKRVEFWQKAIVLHLIQQYAEVSPAELVTITRQLVLAILWMALWQDGSIVRQLLQAEQQPAQLYQSLLSELQRMGDRLGQALPFALPAHLSIKDELLHGLLTCLRNLLPVKPASHLLGQIYEQSLRWTIEQDSAGQINLTSDATHKKSGGIYYTPEPIVHYVIEQTIAQFLPALSPFPSFPLPPSPIVLDPACGAGAFLLAAYQRLLDGYLQTYSATGDNHPALQRSTDGQWRLTQAERSRILQAHIYGVDVDPQAVAITQLTLWLKLVEDLPAPWQPPLPDLSQNIFCGNAIVNLEDRLKQRFQWEKAFAPILQRGGFDAVIGNPPYLDSEQMSVHLPHWRQHCNQHYRSATGNWDLFCIFIEKAIDLCQLGGLVSLVVPNKLSSATYAGTVRQMLSQENQLLAIRDYTQVSAFAASVYPMVFVSRKGFPSAEISTKRVPVRYELMQDLQQVQRTSSIALSELHSDQPQQGWRLITGSQSMLLARLQREFPVLGDIAQIRGAATVAEAYRIQPLIQDTVALTPKDLQVVNSGTIDRYQFLWGTKPLRYLGQSYQRPIISVAQSTELPAKRYQQAQQPKIIVAGMTQRLECALDATGSVLAGKSTSIVWVEGETPDLRYLLGLLNSHLLSFYFSHAFNGNQLQGGYFRVGPPQLRSLPICIPALDCANASTAYGQMLDRVTQRLNCQSQAEAQQLDRDIDRLVYELYRLTASEIDELDELH